MWYVMIVLAFPVFLFATERVTAWVRKARLEKHRAEAEYPTTGNDPVGRTVIF